MHFIIVSGINGNAQVVKATMKELSVTRQNMAIPQAKFTTVPKSIPNNKDELRPITYAIIGKDRMKPPVGPIKQCHPPVKLENTGNPNVPNNM